MCEVTLGKHRLLINVPHQDKAFSLVETKAGERIYVRALFLLSVWKHKTILGAEIRTVGRHLNLAQTALLGPVLH